jgi:hypothetical protein
MDYAQSSKQQTFVCSDCKEVKPIESNYSTGYAVYGDEVVCYLCCAIRDKTALKLNGHNKGVPLYMSHTLKPYVSNWPGTLKFPVVRQKYGKHNVTGHRIDIWFNGPDGFIWYGRNCSSWSDLVRCKRTKQRIQVEI